MKVCPNNPNHKEFITTGVEYHDWLIDADGGFIDDKGCFEARLGDSEWSCATCHATAVEATP